LAKQLQLNPETVYHIFQLIHKESIRRQTEVMNKNEVDNTSANV
jgi:chorismate mutase